VYLPQEHGVWEEMLESYGGDVDKVKRLLNEKDKQAVQACDVIVAYCGDRRPSEGMLWEMGFGVALHKTVLLYNPAKWDFNLMIEYNAIVFEEWIPLERWLAEEDWNR
jgi:nucleoside 2-deoxyribosyltransferase